MRYFWFLFMVAGLAFLWHILFTFTWPQSFAVGWFSAYVIQTPLLLAVELKKTEEHFKIYPYDDDDE